jgi:Protein of unknown function (DUF3489)
MCKILFISPIRPRNRLPLGQRTNPLSPLVGRRSFPARPGTKTVKVLDLLKRPGGVTLKELRKATGWQAHSVRGCRSSTLGKVRTAAESFQSDAGDLGGTFAY